MFCKSSRPFTLCNSKFSCIVSENRKQYPKIVPLAPLSSPNDFHEEKPFDGIYSTSLFINLFEQTFYLQQKSSINSDNFIFKTLSEQARSLGRVASAESDGQSPRINLAISPRCLRFPRFRLFTRSPLRTGKKDEKLWLKEEDVNSSPRNGSPTTKINWGISSRRVEKLWNNCSLDWGADS
jgi:hypothetical protein